MKLKYNFHFQPVGRTYVGVAIGDDAKKFAGMIQLNGVGYDIVSMMNTEVTRDKVIEMLLADYDTDTETATKYVDEIVEYLNKEGVLDVE